jgi:hypothetical protein
MAPDSSRAAAVPVGGRPCHVALEEVLEQVGGAVPIEAPHLVPAGGRQRDTPITVLQ